MKFHWSCIKLSNSDGTRKGPLISDSGSEVPSKFSVGMSQLIAGGCFVFIFGILFSVFSVRPSRQLYCFPNAATESPPLLPQRKIFVGVSFLAATAAASDAPPCPTLSTNQPASTDDVLRDPTEFRLKAFFRMIASSSAYRPLLSVFSFSAC